jgi:hypothetical protein
MGDWKDASIPDGSKLFRSHVFTFMHGGNTFALEIDEFKDASFTGHGEHTIDKSCVIESVSGTSIKDCIEKLAKKIETRS